MARVKVLVNNIPKTIINSRVTLEGERAIDESQITFPLGSTICSGDQINIIQDAVCLNGAVGLYNFQGCVLDESGLCHNAYGAISSPRKDMEINWCQGSQLPRQDGYRCLTVTPYGCITSTTGKVNTKGIIFDGTNDYITVGAECVFDIDQTTTMTFSTWVKTTDTCVPIISKKATGTASKGFEVNIDSCGRAHFLLTSTACSSELDIRSDKIINSGCWTHLAVTYSGVPGCGGNAVEIFINGTADTKGVITDNLTTCTLNNSLLSLGSYADGSSLFTGSLDDISFYVAKKLTSEQIRSVFNKGIMTSVTGRTGDALRFNGIDTFAQIPYTTDHDFCGAFDIQVWARWQSTSTQYLYARRTLGGNGWALSVNRTTPGDIVAEIDGNLIKASGTFNDFNWHFIRVYRGIDNVVHIEVDDVEKNTATVASNLLLLSPDLLIGTNHNKVSYFDGDINTMRIYKGISLSSEQATRIYSCVTAISQMKFGGNAKKVTKEIEQKVVVAQSYGHSLGATEVRAQEYNCRSPEFIIEDLVRNNTSLIPHIHGTCSGIIISRFNADGKLIDIIRDLTQLIGRTFHTDGLNQFHLHDTAFRNTSFVFEHGVDSTSFECVTDDTEIVNDLLIIGEVKRYDTIELFSGDGCTTEFTLTHGAVSSRVTVGGTEKNPDEDYTTCVLNKTIIFTTAPASGSCNINVTYTYEVPLLVRGEKNDSISLYGRHSKRLVMPWLKTRNDALRFINGYLNRFKDIRSSIKLELPVMKNSLNEGDVVRVINNIKNIDSSFVIKSLTWKYPEMNTDVLVGEFKFDDLEYEKQIIEKLHDLESALTEVKELADSESLEEVLCLTDVIRIITGVACGSIFTETLVISDSTTVTIVTTSKYNLDNYNVGIYGTETQISGFTSTGFTNSGFTAAAALPVYNILLESGDAILKEDGDYILLE